MRASSQVSCMHSDMQMLHLSFNWTLPLEWCPNTMGSPVHSPHHQLPIEFMLLYNCRVKQQFIFRVDCCFTPWIWTSIELVWEAHNTKVGLTTWPAAIAHGIKGVIFGHHITRIFCCSVQRNERRCQRSIPHIFRDVDPHFLRPPHRKFLHLGIHRIHPNTKCSFWPSFPPSFLEACPIRPSAIPRKFLLLFLLCLLLPNMFDFGVEFGLISKQGISWFMTLIGDLDLLVNVMYFYQYERLMWILGIVLFGQNVIVDIFLCVKIPESLLILKDRSRPNSNVQHQLWSASGIHLWQAW